jgi:hypothetical protein
MTEPSSPSERTASSDVVRDQYGVRDHYKQFCRCEWSEDDFTRTMTSEDCSIHGKVPDPLAALMAENERLRALNETLRGIGGS